MTIRTILLLFIATAMAAALAVMPAVAGEYHRNANLFCADCHTMHFSMQHGFDGGSVSIGTAAIGGNWLGSTGPNEKLLKAPPNDLCLSCHDGQTFAPDVLGTNTNASPTQGRSAGALNEASLGAPYDTWKGHTLGSTTTPPGFDPSVLGGSGGYDPTEGLECISCHMQHGTDGYRNLRPEGLVGVTSANTRPTYVIGATNDTTKDVWINIPTGYVAGTGSAATFNPYYDMANISFNRNDAVVGSTKTSNRVSADLTSFSALLLLYRGELLEGLSVRDDPLFEEWLLVERERLQLLYLEGLWTLAKAQAEANQLLEAIQTLGRLIEADPLRERSYRSLMQLHLRLGDRSSALRVYKQCSAALAAELGVSPSLKTQMLFEMISKGSPETAMLHMQRAAELLQQQRYQEAKAACAAAEASASDLLIGSQIALLRAEIAMAEGRGSESLSLLRSARQALFRLIPKRSNER